MPEEINRLLTDQVADLLWTPSPDSDDNLLAEGIPAERIQYVGNVMIDALELMRSEIEIANVASKYHLPRRSYGVVTLHRPSNVDERDKLEHIVHRLILAAEKLPLVFPVHPRTRRKLDEFGFGGRLENCKAISLIEPLSYIGFMSLVIDSALVITDSGGIQEETSYLGIPCLTLRENTERPITITLGTNRLVSPGELQQAVEAALQSAPRSSSIPLWDGQTAQRVAKSLGSRAGV